MRGITEKILVKMGVVASGIGLLGLAKFARFTARARCLSPTLTRVAADVIDDRARALIVAYVGDADILDVLDEEFAGVIHEEITNKIRDHKEEILKELRENDASEFAAMLEGSLEEIDALDTQAALIEMGFGTIGEA